MMGFSQGTCTESKDHSNAPETPPPASPSVSDAYYSDYKRLKFRTFLRKLIWDFAFACVASPCSGKSNGKDFKKITLDQNKALLLGENGVVGPELVNAEPQSVHSSFRFSFCSQVELESFHMSSSSAAATFLMVNLECESRAREMKWKRMEPLEKSISPVSNTLIRFNYHEIVYATRNFSKGNFFY